MTAYTHKNTLLQVAQGNALTKICKRVFLFPTQEKLKNKKFPSLQKNKTSQTHNPRQTSIFNVCSLTTTDSATTESRRASANSTLPKVAVSCFVGQFCGHINISASYEGSCIKSPPSASCQPLAAKPMISYTSEFSVRRKA